MNKSKFSGVGLMLLIIGIVVVVAGLVVYIGFAPSKSTGKQQQPLIFNKESQTSKPSEGFGSLAETTPAPLSESDTTDTIEEELETLEIENIEDDLGDVDNLINQL